MPRWALHKPTSSLCEGRGQSPHRWRPGTGDKGATGVCGGRRHDRGSPWYEVTPHGVPVQGSPLGGGPCDPLLLGASVFLAGPAKLFALPKKK